MSSDSTMNVPLHETNLRRISDIVLYAYARDVGFISHQLNGYDTFIREEVKRRLTSIETRVRRRGHESEMSDEEDAADDEAFFQSMNPAAAAANGSTTTTTGVEKTAEAESSSRRKKRNPNLTGLYLRDESDVYSYTKPRKTRAKLRASGVLGGMSTREIAMMGESTTMATTTTTSTTTTTVVGRSNGMMSSNAVIATTTGNRSSASETTTTTRRPRSVSKHRVVPTGTLPTEFPIPFSRREDYEFVVRFTRVMTTRHPEDFETERAVRPCDARDGDAYHYDLTIEVDARVEVRQHGVVKRAYEFKNGEIARIPVMVGSSYCTTRQGSVAIDKEDPDDLGGYFIVNGEQKVLISPERPLRHKIQRIVHDWTSASKFISSPSSSSNPASTMTTTASTSIMRTKAFAYSVAIHSRTDKGIPILTHIGITNEKFNRNGEETRVMMWVPATQKPILVPVPALLEACFETFLEDVPRREDRETIRNDLRKGRHFRNTLNAYERECLRDPIGCVYRACCVPIESRERRNKKTEEEEVEGEEEEVKRRETNDDELECVRGFLQSRFLSQCDEDGTRRNRIELLHHMIVELEHLAANPLHEFDDPIDMANKSYATPTILLSELFDSLVKRATRMACELGAKNMQKRHKLDETIERMMLNGLFSERRDEVATTTTTTGGGSSSTATTGRRNASSNLARHNTVTKGLSYAFKTGNWTGMRHGGVGGTSSVGVCQILDETNTFAILAEARKLVSGEHRESKNTEKRQLHASFFGYTCSNETPDGKKVGHIRTLGLLTTFSLDRSKTDDETILHRFVSRFGKPYLEMIAETSSSSSVHREMNDEPFITPSSSRDTVTILLNGFVVGGIHRERVETLRDELVRARRRGEISFDVSIVLRKRRLEIRTDAGRPVRPFYVVTHHENGGGGGFHTIPHVEVNELMSSTTRFQDLVSRGVIEYMDAAESELAQIAMEHHRLDPRVVYTHCEIHPSAQMGVSVACIPFSDCNPSPRNTYYAGMCKQAIGAMRANAGSRFTTKTMVMTSPQKPLVSTKFTHLLGKFRAEDNVLPKYLNPASTHIVETPFGTRTRGGRVVEKRETGLDAYPHGANANVLMGMFQGFNQEDSLLMNRDSIDRGMFRHVTYVSYECEFDETHMVHSDVWNPETRKYDSRCESRITERRFANFFDAKKSVTNFPDSSQVIKAGDVIVPRFEFNEDTTTVLDSSLCYPSREPNARVDEVRTFVSRRTGKTIVQVRLRIQYVPEIGDKFTSRYSQKGVASMMYSSADLPFSASEGMNPDVVMNPNSIPSRMTIGQLREMLEGKYGAIMGFDWRDSTAFQNSFRGFDDEEEEEEEVGMEISGIERLIERFETAVRNSGTENQKRILHRWDGLERFYHPHTGLLIENTMFAGLCYYTRLKHLAGPKCYARATGPVDHLTRQPKHGRRYGGGIRHGEMERDCLVTHGVPNVLKDRTVECSDPFTIRMCPRCGSQPTEFTSGGVPRCGACSRRRRRRQPQPRITRRPLDPEKEAELAARAIDEFLANDAFPGENRAEANDEEEEEEEKFVTIRLRFAAKLLCHELIAMGMDVRLFVEPNDAAIGMLEPENRKRANYDPTFSQRKRTTPTRSKKTKPERRKPRANPKRVAPRRKRVVVAKRRREPRKKEKEVGKETTTTTTSTTTAENPVTRRIVTRSLLRRMR